jgi:hypothetical protein
MQRAISKEKERFGSDDEESRRNTKMQITVSSVFNTSEAETRFLERRC